MASRIVCVQNDNNIKLVFNIKKDDRIESILGAIVRLEMISSDGETVLKRICTITDPTSAECMYILTKEDLAFVGSYRTEIQVKYANGTELTHRNPFILSIVPEIVP